jgi:toxin ParE1/3/4
MVLGVYRIPRFPYLVIFLEADAAIQLVAVAHGKRRPGYWRKRLP